MAVTDDVDFLLTPLDPVRALRRIASDVDRLAALDPKLGEAISLVRKRLQSVPPGTSPDETLPVVFWLQLRGHLMSQPSAVAAVRRWLGDSDAVLRSVERALDTSLTVEVLQQLSAEATTLTDGAYADHVRFSQARQELDEVQGGRPQDSILVVIAVAVVVGCIIGAEIGEVVHASHAGGGPRP
jgi:hypothetical protein